MDNKQDYCRKKKNLIILALALLILFTENISAENNFTNLYKPQLFISIDNKNTIEDIRVIVNNAYYGEKYYPLLTEEYGEEMFIEPEKFHYRLRLSAKDKESNNKNDYSNYHFNTSEIPLEIFQLNNRFALEFNPKITTIEIFDDAFNLDNKNRAIITKQISFCNNNNICEPCLGVHCNLMESILTCSDCMTGSNDYVCDLFSDGVCDPDCENKDKDCDSCKKDADEKTNNCYAYAEESECSEEYGGETCFFGKSCAEGEGITIENTLCCPDSYCITSFFLINEKKNETTDQKPNQEKDIQFVNQIAANKKESFAVYFILIGVLAATIVLSSIYFIIRLQKSKILVVEIQRLKNRYSYAEIKVYLDKQGYKKEDIELAIQQHYLYDQNVKKH